MSAFGDIPEGGINGALVIRDPKILSQLVDSSKIYRGTAEIEALLPANIKLGKPSQTLFTHGAQGNRLTLLVYGKPYTKAEIAKLKIIGSLDNIRNLVKDPVRITGKAKYDDFNALRRQAVALDKEAKSLKVAGKIAEAQQTARAAQVAVGRARAMITGMSGRGLRLLSINTQVEGPLQRLERGTRTKAEIARTKGIERRLTPIDTTRAGRARLERVVSARPGRLARAERIVFSMTREERLGEKCRILSASLTFFPRTRSATRIIFLGAMRT